MAEVKLNNVEHTLRFRRGLRARVYKPDLFYNHAEIPTGEPIYTTDTRSLYIVDSAGVQPLQTVNMLVVHENDFVWHNDEPVIND